MLILCLGLLPVLTTGTEDAPVLTVWEANNGQWEFTGGVPGPIELVVEVDVALEFSWLADASGYGGIITGYRYGWDVADPDDPDDPGWATDFQPDLLSAPPQSFSEGLHSLHILAQDSEEGMSRAWFLLDVQPNVPAVTTSWGSVKAVFRN